MYIEYPSILAFYKPDWVNEKDKVVIETKGIFDSADRKKMLLVKSTFPDWLFIIVFYKSTNRITKKSKVTYGDWCTKNGIPFVDIKDVYEDPKCLLNMIKALRNGK